MRRYFVGKSRWDRSSIVARPAQVVLMSAAWEESTCLVRGNFNPTEEIII